MKAAVARPASVSNSWRQGAGCVHDWFAVSGIPPMHEVHNCVEYARRLTRYISDASTVRARTIDHYGEAPPLEIIREMRAHWLEIVEYRASNSYTYGLKEEEERAEREKKVGKLKLVRTESCDPAPVDLKPITGVVLLTATDVIDACAAATGFTHGELIGTDRRPAIVQARNLLSAVIRARGSSYPATGRFIGGRDHSTVIYAVRKFFKRDMSNEKFAAAWAVLAPDDCKHCRSVTELDAVILGRSA